MKNFKKNFLFILLISFLCMPIQRASAVNKLAVAGVAVGIPAMIVSAIGTYYLDKTRRFYNKKNELLKPILLCLIALEEKEKNSGLSRSEVEEKKRVYERISTMLGITYSPTNDIPFSTHIQNVLFKKKAIFTIAELCSIFILGLATTSSVTGTTCLIKNYLKRRNTKKPPVKQPLDNDPYENLGDSSGDNDDDSDNSDAQEKERKRLSKKKAQEKERRRLAEEKAEKEERKHFARKRAKHKRIRAKLNQKKETKKLALVTKKKTQEKERRRLAKEKAEEEERTHFAKKRAKRKGVRAKLRKIRRLQKKN